MRHRLNRYVPLTLALTACTALAACSSTSPESTDSPDGSAAPSGEEVTLRFTWWGGDERATTTQKIIENFMAENPGITVVGEPTAFEGYWDKLATDVAANNTPDVITLASPYTLEYATAGALLPLEQVADSVSWDEFPDSTLAGATADGVLYGLPTGGNAIGLVANPQVFADAGVELPDDSSWTWAEFIELANTISASTEDGTYGVENRINDTLGVYVTQRGTSMYTEDGAFGPSVETLADYWTTTLALLDGGGMPPADVTQEIYTLGPSETLMGTGRAAMSFAFSNLLGTYQEGAGSELVLLRPPGETEFAQPGASIQASQYFAVGAASQHPEEAAMLLDYLVNSTEAGELVLADRGLPFNPTVLEAIRPMLDPAAQVAAEYVTLTAAEGAPPAPPTPPGATVQKDTSERLDGEVLFKRLSPTEAAQQFYDEMTAAVGG